MMVNSEYVLVMVVNDDGNGNIMITYVMVGYA